MKRAWKVLLLIVIFTLLFMGLSAASAAAQNEKMPVFSAKDRELITDYYKHLYGTLAPGSLDRSGFSLGIEKALVAGSHVPMQLEKDLEPLPTKLESELSLTTGGYRRYKLGPHVVLVRSADLAIADIIKNAGMK
jgi:hypothetical protein